MEDQGKAFVFGLAVVGSVSLGIGYLFYRSQKRKQNQDSGKIKEFSKHHRLDGIPFLVAEDIREYREIARNCLRSSDVVLEIGCAGGVTTSIIDEFVSDCVGVDIGNNSIERYYYFMNLLFFLCS